jgi:hypothetical protein
MRCTRWRLGMSSAPRKMPLRVFAGTEGAPLHGPGVSGYVPDPVNPVDHIVDSMPGALVVGVIVVIVAEAIAP